MTDLKYGAVAYFLKKQYEWESNFVVVFDYSESPNLKRFGDDLFVYFNPWQHIENGSNETNLCNRCDSLRIDLFSIGMYCIISSQVGPFWRYSWRISSWEGLFQCLQDLQTVELRSGNLWRSLSLQSFRFIFSICGKCRIYTKSVLTFNRWCVRQRYIVNRKLWKLSCIFNIISNSVSYGNIKRWGCSEIQDMRNTEADLGHCCR